RFTWHYLNNSSRMLLSLMIAAVNVAVRSSGRGLVALVASTTAVRLLSLAVFVWNAYRAFPGLNVRPALFRRARLHEVTGFSVYMFVLDIAAKMNYSTDKRVIGAMLNTTTATVLT